MFSSKPELRNAALKRRDAVPAEIHAAFAARLADVGPDLIARWDAAKGLPVVSLYSPIGSEPDVAPLAATLDGRGVPLALPIDFSSGMSLVYRRWVPGNPLASGPLGIGEPLDDAEPCDPDIVFTPLAAFDRRGGRIGYGAGNVDKTLRALRARKPLLVIGVAFSTQEEARVPTEANDEPMDVVVTEIEVIDARVAREGEASCNPPQRAP